MSTAMWIDFLLVIVFVACVWMGRAQRNLQRHFRAAGQPCRADWLAVADAAPGRLYGPADSAFFERGVVSRAAESLGLTELLSSPVVEETRTGFAELLQALGVPETLWENLTASAQTTRYLRVSAAAGQALAEQLAPVITFVVLFLVIQLAVRIVCSLLSLDLPILRSVNKLGGALLGAVTGLCMVAVLCWGIMRFSPAEEIGFLNQPALLESRIGGTVCGLLGLERSAPDV